MKSLNPTCIQLTQRYGFLLSFSLLSLGQAQDVARMEQVIQDSADRKQFMGSIAVAREDKILLSKSYGFANLEWNIPNTPATKFRLGSLTKQFTAAAFLLLEERGKLRLDDPMKKYLPDAPAAWDKITLFHLLTHTSGIPNFTSFPDYPTIKTLRLKPSELVAKFQDKPLDFEPGEKMRYSNSGYILLGDILERISGETYETFVSKNIFDPLAMKDSGYDSNRAIIPHRAAGYEQSKNGLQNAGFIDMSIPLAAGALYSTTEDMVRWEHGLFGGKLLTPASVQKMLTPYKGDYALGVSVRNKDGHKEIAHAGGIDGFNTFLLHYPDAKATVVVLSNLAGPTAAQIARYLGVLVLGGTVQLPSERTVIAVPTATLQSYVGTYHLASALELTVSLEGNQLTLQAKGLPNTALFAESETLFFAKSMDAELEFSKETDGSVLHFMLKGAGRSERATRIP